MSVQIPSSLPSHKAVEVARTAENTGIGRVWLSEDMFQRGSMPTAGAIAQATSVIGIGFGVVTLYGQHPAHLAMQLVSLLELAGSRVTVGVGAGGKERLARIGSHPERPLTAMVEATQILAQLLAGRQVSVHGSAHVADRLELDVPLGSPPPIYFAASGPQSLYRAGELADGVLLSVMSTPGRIEWAISRIGDGARAAGRPMPRVVVFVPAHLDRRSDEGAARAKETVASFIQRWGRLPTLRGMFTDFGPFEEKALEEVVGRLDAGDPPQQVISDAAASSLCLFGSIDEIDRQIDRMRALGIDEVALSATGDGELAPVLHALAGQRPTP